MVILTPLGLDLQILNNKGIQKCPNHAKSSFIIPLNVYRFFCWFNLCLNGIVFEVFMRSRSAHGVWEVFYAPHIFM